MICRKKSLNNESKNNWKTIHFWEQSSHIWTNRNRKRISSKENHKNSLRSKESFVIINAALLKETTYERELFGEEFEDGNISFGALERANKGTLLIDEVSEIPYETQANVLRVLIDQKFKRLNGSRDINVNIRLISSTSKNLSNLVKNGKFEDLFHRLNVMPIELTSLNSRTEDISLLIRYFVEKLSEINGVQKPNIDINNDIYILIIGQVM